MKLKLLKRTILNRGALWLSYLKLLPITRKLDAHSVVLDCGANVGDITKKFAATGATVHAFEPDPVAFEILKRRFQTTSNVILHNQGVWDRETDISLYSHKDQDSRDAAYTVSSSIIGDKINIDQSKGQVIHVIDLSEFIHNLGRTINVIKLDVEGAEIGILKKILNDETYRLFDDMYVETHETKIPGHSEELKKIKALMHAKNVSNIKLNWL